MLEGLPRGTGDFGGDGYVHYCDCDNHFLYVKIIRLFTLDMCSVICQLYPNK